MTNNLDAIRLTDKPAIAIVEHYQRQVDDKQAGRTLVRIIQTFHAMGGQLGPVATQAPEGQGVGVTAAPMPSATQPT
ncbi:MAG TPA: hypothetical protein DCM28_02840 [Phycisphaerales bacterium]|nr:hypothetical protein [Phycisphaerales bacterium]HCD31640.1 hypothetical protein [Phycisphaerales bacterium]|tara:strand:- start:1783 stop:2013 length:231 start_codon:yes stop_codon:yes gene_type:complete